MRWPRLCAVLSLLPALVEGRMLDDPTALFAADLDELLAVKVQVASRTDASLLEAASVVSLITAADIRQMGARDLRDVLRQLPGFELGIRVFGYPEFGLRCFGNVHQVYSRLIYFFWFCRYRRQCYGFVRQFT